MATQATQQDTGKGEAGDAAAITKTIVVAVARNGIIGREGGMPWRLSTDLKRFKALTVGKPIIVGRKTFESFGKALPGRTNIIVTRATDYHPEGAEVVHSLKEAIELAEVVARRDGVDEIAIVGGGDIYRQAMDIADRLLVTHISASIDGDTAFPAIDPDMWQILETQDVPAGEKDDHETKFVEYRRSTH